MRPFIIFINSHIALAKSVTESTITRSIIYKTGKVFAFLLILTFWRLLFPSVLLADTSVIVIRKPEQILIGADSLSKTLEGGETRKVCKIIQAGEHLFFTSAGVVENTRTGYSVRMIAAQAARQPGTLIEKVAIFERLIKPQLEEELEAMRFHRRHIYRTRYDINDKVVLECAFAGNENGILKVAYRQFRLTNPETEPVSTKILPTDCPGKCASPLGWARPIGHQSKMGPYLNQFLPTATDFVAIINQGISLEFAAGHSGPPIDILEFTKTGVR